MIYASQERAEYVATWLNSTRLGGEARAVLTGHGWTVVRRQVWA